ncbi:MAG: hypothetical protein ACHQAX_09080 [Gammaproteobacteria bacterium]
MKLRIVSTIILSAVCLSIFAAPAAVVNRYVDDFMIRMKSKTKLTDDQTQALANILYEGINEREDIIQSYDGEKNLISMRNMKSELQDANDVTVSDAREILDHKQFEVFQSIQSENREKLKKRIQN